MPSLSQIQKTQMMGGIPNPMASSSAQPANTRAQVMNYQNFMKGQPDWYDLLRWNLANRPNIHQDVNQLMRQTGSVGTQALGGAAAVSAPIAYTNLAQLLLGQGRADPMALNQALARSGRDTQGTQAALQGRLAQAGMQTSGIGQTLGAAVDVAGQGQRAQMVADDLAQSEARRRADLELYNQMIQSNLIDLLGIERGSSAARSQLEAEKGNRWLQALGIGLTGFGNLFNKP